jgi:hypothetical protein
VRKNAFIFQEDLPLISGRAIRMDGHRLAGRGEIQCLPARDVLFLHQQGSLGIAYCRLQSQRNWQRLPDLANRREPAGKGLIDAHYLYRIEWSAGVDRGY